MRKVGPYIQFCRRGKNHLSPDKKRAIQNLNSLGGPDDKDIQVLWPSNPPKKKAYDLFVRT